MLYTYNGENFENTIAPLFFNCIFIELSSYEGRDKLSYDNDLRAKLDSPRINLHVYA